MVNEYISVKYAGSTHSFMSGVWLEKFARSEAGF